jgi:hypothetical protein
MDAIFDPSKDLLDVIIQVLIIVIPVIVTWFLRTYVKNSGAETEVALVVRLANAAIDFVEDLDKSGALELPPKVSKGAHKLQLAGRWLVDELQRVGIKTTEDQARDWSGGGCWRSRPTQTGWCAPRSWQPTGSSPSWLALG